MWTFTWDFLCIGCFFLGSEDAMATMAVVGICSINAPYHIGFHVLSPDLLRRTIYGMSGWIWRDMCGLESEVIVQLWEKHSPALKATCFFIDHALHTLPALVILQGYAHSIRSSHVLWSIVVTGLWFVTVSLKHNVVDWQFLVGQWRFRLMKWGESSFWEPRKVAQIYQMINPYVEQDEYFMECVPILAKVTAVAHIVTLFVTLLPNAGTIFFAIGLGHFVSTNLILKAIPCFVGCGFSIVAFVTPSMYQIATHGRRGGSKKGN